MKIYSRFDLPEAPDTPAGSEMEPIYSYRDNPDKEQGGQELYDTGRRENIQEKIDAELPNHDIRVILARAMAGDAQALAANKAIYADITGAPRSILEAHEKAAQLRQLLAQLTPEEREEFYGTENPSVGTQPNDTGNSTSGAGGDDNSSSNSN